MDRPSVISGTVLDANGQPVPDAQIYFIEGPVSLPDVAILTDGTGAFTLTVPVPGTYIIGCNAAGFAPANVTVNVKKGQNPQIEVRLKKL